MNKVNKKRQVTYSGWSLIDISKSGEFFGKIIVTYEREDTAVPPSSWDLLPESILLLFSDFSRLLWGL